MRSKPNFELFETKKALRMLERKEAEEMMRQHGMVAIPSNVVFTIKPGTSQIKGKKKRRTVACGNFDKDEGGDYFAAGADAASLRMALALASKRRWSGRNLDVCTAFLNAPMKRDRGRGDEGEESLKPVLLRPPAVPGYFSPDQWWLVLKAAYGFRESPCLWSDHRDDELHEMKVGDLKLFQLESEPYIWLIKKSKDASVEGLVLTYVDDLCFELRRDDEDGQQPKKPTPETC